jgi:hypothetical protein
MYPKKAPAPPSRRKRVGANGAPFRIVGYGNLGLGQPSRREPGVRLSRDADLTLVVGGLEGVNRRGALIRASHPDISLQ